jgi:DNA-binding response OmpR family regulator
MNKLKVLVVETEMPAAMRMVSLLTQVGFEVQVATRGRKGMEIAQEQKFDLILLEADLPDISAFKICAELKQRHISYRTPVIFLADPHGDRYRGQVLEAGAADLIEKPFRADDFISRVLSQLEETTVA